MVPHANRLVIAGRDQETPLLVHRRTRGSRHWRPLSVTSQCVSNADVSEILSRIETAFKDLSSKRENESILSEYSFTLTKKLFFYHFLLSISSLAPSVQNFEKMGFMVTNFFTFSSFTGQTKNHGPQMNHQESLLQLCISPRTTFLAFLSTRAY